MKAQIEARCTDVTKVWRGVRGTGDLLPAPPRSKATYLVGGALVISGDGFEINLVGTPTELEAFKTRLVTALEAVDW